MKAMESKQHKEKAYRNEKSLLPSPHVSSVPVSAPERIQLAKGKYGLQSPNPSITEWSAEEGIAAETQALNKHTPLTKFPSPLTLTTFHKEPFVQNFHSPNPLIRYS